MKNKLLGFIALLIIGFITYLGYNTAFNEHSKCCASENNTELLVVNGTDSSVVVYLTLGADTNYVTNVNGIYGITSNGLQGSFILGANDTVSYTSICGKGFNGNLSFGGAPNNCPDTVAFPLGMNIFEFALNNNFAGIPNAQETIDISCVSGVNCKITCNLSENNWNAGGDTSKFTSFGNSYLYDNVGRVGVFPFGCDSCILIKNPPTCLNKKFSEPQKKSICQVMRDATKKGGDIYVIYGGVINGVPAEK